MPAGSEYQLKTYWNPSGKKDDAQELKSWNLGEFKGLRQTSSHERDPRTGQDTRFQGVLLSTVLDTAMKSLRPEQRAQVDLVILKAKGGQEALIPRGMVVKYPVMIAEGAGFQSVIPWTSKPRIRQEGIPLEPLFLQELESIELTNYQSLYGELLLKRRTDPAAMRGEKLFVQNCVGCHGTGKGPSVADILGPERGQKTRDLAASSVHPTVAGLPKLSDRDRRALLNYLNEHHVENSTSTSIQAEAKGF